METTNKINQEYDQLTVGKIVARDYRKAKVFKKYGIDFCCGGNIKIDAAAKEVNENPTEIIKDLQLIDAAPTNDAENYEAWETNRLIDHIVEKHHNYVAVTIDQLLPMVEKVARVHGHWRTELIDIENQFKAIANELTTHMYKEEKVLFPLIKELVQHKNLENTSFGSVQAPIRMMLMEHDAAGDIMKEISRLTDGYTLPKGACATYTVMYRTLEEFENDLHTHIHLENNILFPRAIELEK